MTGSFFISSNPSTHTKSSLQCPALLSAIALGSGHIPFLLFLIHVKMATLFTKTIDKGKKMANKYISGYKVKYPIDGGNVELYLSWGTGSTTITVAQAEYPHVIDLLRNESPWWDPTNQCLETSFESSGEGDG